MPQLFSDYAALVPLLVTLALARAVPDRQARLCRVARGFRCCRHGCRRRYRVRRGVRPCGALGLPGRRAAAMTWDFTVRLDLMQR